MIKVKANDKWGFVRLFEYSRNAPIHDVIPPIYDAVNDFEGIITNPKALVALNGEQFYIDIDGKRVE